MSRSYRNFKRKPIASRQVNSQELFARKLLAVEILSNLDENGFKRCKRLEGNYGDASEVVYVKPLTSNNRYLVAVYTSCNQIGGTFIARPLGKDAIRVAGLYVNSKGNTVGVVKNSRVNRVNSPKDICKRMNQKIASSFIKLGQKSLSNERCADCGAPTFLSKKNNVVCSEYCWSKK